MLGCTISQKAPFTDSLTGLANICSLKTASIMVAHALHLNPRKVSGSPRNGPGRGHTLE